MLNPFDWIRARVRQAIIDGTADGTADGLEAIDAPSGIVPPAMLDRLQQRTAPALAPPSAADPIAEPEPRKRGSR